MLLLLDYSGHYPNQLVEVTDAEYKELLRIQGNKYLFDTEEGRKKIEELEARATTPISITAYA